VLSLEIRSPDPPDHRIASVSPCLTFGVQSMGILPRSSQCLKDLADSPQAIRSSFRVPLCPSWLSFRAVFQITRSTDLPIPRCSPCLRASVVGVPPRSIPRSKGLSRTIPSGRIFDFPFAAFWGPLNHLIFRSRDHQIPTILVPFRLVQPASIRHFVVITHLLPSLFSARR
jgi:hypothetical protein